MQMIRPPFEEIEAELSALRARPAGNIRIIAGEHPAVAILRPALARFLPAHPDINVEVTVDYGLTDIVSARFDAGVRLGEQVAKDMIAVRIGGEVCMAVVRSPAYFAEHSPPHTTAELTGHNCINMRLPIYRGVFAWEFKKDGRELKVRVEGQLVFNNLALRLGAALDGLSLAYLPEDQVVDHLQSGRLVRALSEWCPPFAGYHLYYPSRRASPAFTLLADAPRFRG